MLVIPEFTEGSHMDAIYRSSLVQHVNIFQF